MIEQLLLEDIQRIIAFVKDSEEEFISLVTSSSEKTTAIELKSYQKELDQSQARITTLDSIIQKLYEDNVVGKISDERFTKMSATYELEQQQLTDRVSNLQEYIVTTKEKSLNAEHFLNLVKKYTDIQELDAKVIREFVAKINVIKIEPIAGQRRTQQIQIIYNCIGVATLPTKQEKTA